MTRFFYTFLPVFFPVFFAATSLNAQQNVIITVSSDTVNLGDTVCLPVTVQNFEKILGAQMVLNWDSSALEFISIEETGISTDPLTLFDYNYLVTEQRVRWTWEDIDPLYEGTTAEDGSIFFIACFRALQAGVKGTVVCNGSGLPVSSPVAIEDYQGANLYGANTPVPGMVCINEPSPVINIAEQSTIRISPNPFSHSLQISNNGPGLFQLADMSGRTVFSVLNPATSGQILLPELLPGVYVARWIEQDGKVFSLKMIRLGE